MWALPNLLLPPGLRADRDFPGQVTRGTGSGSRAKALQHWREGPGEGRGLEGGCAHRGPPGESQHDGKPRHPGKGKTADTTPAQGLLRNAVPRLQLRALEVGGAQTLAGNPSERPRSPRPPPGPLLEPAGSLLGSRALSLILAADFRLCWETWRSLLCPWRPLGSPLALSLPDASGLCFANFEGLRWLLFSFSSPSPSKFLKRCPRQKCSRTSVIVKLHSVQNAE